MPSLSSKDSSSPLKRHAESDPEGEPPIKKLELLQLGTAMMTFIICFSSNTLEAQTNSLAQGSTVSADEQAQDQNELTDSDNVMLLDDTKHTSYIHDIERELASIEAEEKRISFLPDIEKVLNAIPKSVLSEPKPEQNELVLYRVPRSLTVTEDQDNVRKAIIESRARARARRAESSAYSPSVVPQSDEKDNSVFTFEADDMMDVDSLQQ